ncbi:MAG: right-handed parallel beta-helix repeat-containing protein [Chloroflexi bacterium]|nr:right-handed parallel beta-helix repeat-containing protein [Chloroflexota bacterium]
MRSSLNRTSLVLFVIAAMVTSLLLIPTTLASGNILVDAGADQTADEGATVSVAASFTDTQPGTHTATINWNDGSAPEAGTVTDPADPNPGAVAGSHVYTDNGTYDVRVMVRNQNTAEETTDTLRVTVNNVAPAVDAGVDQTASEGGTVNLSATFTDAGSADTHTATIDWGDGSAPEAGTLTEPAGPNPGTVTGSHVYADNGTYTVTVTVTDNDGDSGSDTLLVTVNNAAPVVNAGPDQTGDTDGTVSLAPATFTDAGAADTHTATIDWGDGPPVAGIVDQALHTVSGSHSYAASGTYTVTVAVTDDDSGSGSDTLEVEVTNVPPVVNAGADQAADEGSPVNLSATYTDADAGDTHTALIDWGDGSAPEAGTVTEPAGANPGTVSGSHVYADNGNYPVTVTVNDGAADGSDSARVTVSNVPPVNTFRPPWEGGDLRTCVSDPNPLLVGPVYDFVKEGLELLDQHNDPAWGDNWCGPTSAGISLGWFAERGYSELVPDTNGNRVVDEAEKYAVIDALGGLMGTDPDAGTADDDLVNGIRAYLDSVGLGNSLTVKVYDTELGTTDPTAADYRSELEAGEDVLVGLGYAAGGGHWLVGRSVSNTANDDGSTNVSFVDPGTGQVYHTTMNADGSFEYNGETVSFDIMVAVSPIKTGVPFTLEGLGPDLFTDAGSADTHTAVINWGDGDTTPGTVVEPRAGQPGSVDGSHAYANPGVYDGQVCKIDDDGGRGCSPFTVVIQPRLWTDPQRGPVGTMLDVHGFNFPVGEVGISASFDGVYFDTGAIGALTADEQGSWNSRMVVPLVPGGPHEIDVRGSRTPWFVGDYFLVDASLQIAPAEGPTGQRVYVRGKGFGAGETGIRTTYDGAAVAGPAQADYRGSFFDVFVVPPSANGTHEVDARGDLTPLEDGAAPVLFSVTPAWIVLGQNTARFGDTVVMRGQGFGPNDTRIEIELVSLSLASVSPIIVIPINRSDGQPCSADAAGNADCQFRLPSMPGGPYAVDGRSASKTLEHVAGTRLQVDPLLVIDPTSGRVGAPAEAQGFGFQPNETDIRVRFRLDGGLPAAADVPPIRVTGFNENRDVYPLRDSAGNFIADPTYGTTTLGNALLDPANFGPGGVVPRPIQFLPFVDVIAPGSLVNPDGTRNADVFFGSFVWNDLGPGEAAELASFLLHGGVVYLGSDPQVNALFPAIGSGAQYTDNGLGNGCPVLSGVPGASPVTSGPFGNVGQLGQCEYNEFVADPMVAPVVPGPDGGTLVAEGPVGAGYLATSGGYGLHLELFTNGGFPENVRYFMNLFALPAGMGGGQWVDVAGGITADENGEWQAPWNVPPSSTGDHAVGAEGSGTPASAVLDVPFEVTGAIWLERDPNTFYPTIQDAVNAALPGEDTNGNEALDPGEDTNGNGQLDRGDTVMVQEGEYTENVTVDKRELRVRATGAADDTRWQSAGGGPALTLLGNGDGFWLGGSGLTLIGGPGAADYPVQIDGASGVLIQGNTILLGGATSAIYVTGAGAPGLAVFSNTLEQADRPGGATIIRVLNTAMLSIAGNRFVPFDGVGGGTSMRLQAVSNAIIKDNITDRAGIALAISGCGVCAGGAGISTNGINVVHNQFLNGRGPAQVRLADKLAADGAVVNVSNVSLRGNTISGGAGDGVKLEALFGGAISNVVANWNNLVSNAGLGINNTVAGLTVDGRWNWWGDPAGPAGPAGDGVSANVNVEPYVDARINFAHMDPNGHSIQSAIDSADPGNYVVVWGGNPAAGPVIYDEAVVINKPGLRVISPQGRDLTWIAPSAAVDSVVQVLRAADGLRLGGAVLGGQEWEFGFTVAGADFVNGIRLVAEDVGGVFTDASNVRIQHSRVLLGGLPGVNGRNGISTTKAEKDDLRVENNDLQVGADKLAVAIAGSPATNVRVWRNTFSLVTTVPGGGALPPGGTAIQLIGVQGGLVQENQIDGAGVGIQLAGNGASLVDLDGVQVRWNRVLRSMSADVVVVNQMLGAGPATARNMLIEGNVLADGAGDGVRVVSNTADGVQDLHINYNNILNHAGVGVRNEMAGNPQPPVDAHWNWWGDPTGPLGPTGDGIAGNVQWSSDSFLRGYALFVDDEFDVDMPGFGVQSFFDIFMAVEAADLEQNPQDNPCAPSGGCAIVVWPGRYYGPIEIRQTTDLVSVAGARETFIEADDPEPVVEAEGPNVTGFRLHGFNLVNNDAAGAGLRMHGESGGRQASSFFDVFFAVDNIINLEPQGGIGIQAQDIPGVLKITGNTINCGGTCIEVSDTESDVFVMRNTLNTDQGAGIRMWNTVGRPGREPQGANGPSLRNHIMDNVVQGNAGQGGHGISLGGDDAEVLPREISRLFTDESDWAQGEGVGVTHTAVPGQIQLSETGQLTFPFIWIALSGRGTIAKVDTATGVVLGEYASAPAGMGKNPSRTTVDINGNVWAGNRDESGGNAGSVVQVGLRENGQCVDRNANGTIETSTGLGDVKPWAGPDVASAQDECIIKFVRTPNAPNVRHVSVDGNNDVWVGGYPYFPTSFVKVSGGTGAILDSFASQCGGYGGLVDGNGILWSAAISQSVLLRYDPVTRVQTCIGVPLSYGLGIDSNGFIWNATWDDNRIAKIDPAGVVQFLKPSGGSGSRGVAVTPDDNIWVANSHSNTVTRLNNNGDLVAIIPVGAQPTGVAVDAAGKVWVTNYDSWNAMRIDPATNAVDLTVPLGQSAYPYNYSDMTGAVVLGAQHIGSWRTVVDGGAPGIDWDNTVAWTSQEPDGTSVVVEVRTSETDVFSGDRMEVQNGVPFDAPPGRYLEVKVTLRSDAAGATPIVEDLTVHGVGHNGTSSVHVSGNQVQGAGGNGVLLQARNGHQMSDVAVVGNDLRDNAGHGLYVDGDGGLNKATVQAHYNNLVDNAGKAIDTTFPEPFQAQLNYYGAPGGPTHPSNNRPLQGAEVADGVVYVPWLATPVHVGGSWSFDPNVELYNDAGMLMALSELIQPVLDINLPGDTVLVRPGEYGEALTVRVPNVTLASSNGQNMTSINPGAPVEAVVDVLGTASGLSFGEGLVPGPDGGIPGFGFTIVVGQAANGIRVVGASDVLLANSRFLMGDAAPGSVAINEEGVQRLAVVNSFFDVFVEQIGIGGSRGGDLWVSGNGFRVHGGTGILLEGVSDVLIGTEDLNGNGVLDDGEDTNGNGALDQRNTFVLPHVLERMGVAIDLSGCGACAPPVGAMDLTVRGNSIVAEAAAAGEEEDGQAGAQFNPQPEPPGIVFVHDGGAQVDGVWIVGNEVSGSPRDGIAVMVNGGGQVQNVRVIGNSVHGSEDTGILLKGLGGVNEAASNQVGSNGGDGLLMQDFGGRAHVAGNVLEGNADLGLSVRNVNDSVFEGNGISANGHGGAYFESADGNEFRDNSVIGNGAFGVQLSQSHQNVLAHNIVEHNVTDGMALLDSTGNQVVDNTIRGNGRNGVSLVNSNGDMIGGVAGMSLDELLAAPEGGNLIDGNGGSGVGLVNSNDNLVQVNRIRGNGDRGVVLVESTGNLVGGNEVIANRDVGIDLIRSPENSVLRNLIANKQVEQAPAAGAGAAADVKQPKGQPRVGEHGGPVLLGAGGPDGFGYTWMDSDQPGGPQFNWVEISNSGQWLGDVSQCDDCAQQVPIGFGFQFYGNTYDNLWVGSNGILGFGPDEDDFDWFESWIPDSSTPNNVISAFGDDLLPGSMGDVYVQTVGSAPNRKLVVQWDGVTDYSYEEADYTFQVILEEGTNRIRFQYLSMVPPYDEYLGEWAIIGIENSSGSDGLPIANEVADYVHDGLAVLISPPQGEEPPPAALVQLVGIGLLHSDGNTIAGNEVNGNTTDSEILAQSAAVTEQELGTLLSNVGSAAPGEGPHVAVPGTLLGTMRVPVPSSIGVSVAFDGQYIYYTNYGDRNIYVVRPPAAADMLASPNTPIVGTLVRSFDPGAYVQAMGWDSKRRVLWGGWQGINQPCGQVYRIDPVAGVAVPVFVAISDSYCFDDGMAYDEGDPNTDADDSLWISDDVSRNIHHYSVTGAHLGQISVDFPSSGIAVGGDILYLGSNGWRIIYRYQKDGTFIDQFASPPGPRDEDLECDPVTFASIGVDAMWSKDAYDNNIYAMEIPRGTCGMGGQPPGPPPPHFEMGPGQVGILAVNSDANLMEGNEVKWWLRVGIGMTDHSDTNRALDNHVHDNGNGVMLFNSMRNEISRNLIEHHRGSGNPDEGMSIPGIGVFLNSTSDYNVVQGNTVDDSAAVGIFLRLSSHNLIGGDTPELGNVVTNSGYVGIYLLEAGGNTLLNNTVDTVESQDEGPGMGIVLLLRSNQNVVGSNHVSNVNYGIVLYDAHTNRVLGNTVQDLVGGTWQEPVSGIGVLLSKDNALQNNQVLGAGQFGPPEQGAQALNGSSASFGITLVGAGTTLVSGNILDGHIVGLFLNRSNGNRLLTNRVGAGVDAPLGNIWGIVLDFADANKVGDLQDQGNEVANSLVAGIDLFFSWKNEVRGNNVHDNGSSSPLPEVASLGLPRLPAWTGAPSLEKVQVQVPEDFRQQVNSGQAQRAELLGERGSGAFSMDFDWPAGILLDVVSDYNTVDQNQVHHNVGDGIRLGDAWSDQVTGNTVRDNEANGILLKGAQYIQVAGNTVHGHRTAEEGKGMGIGVLWSPGSRVAGNVVGPEVDGVAQGNLVGIFVQSYGNIAVADNTVQGNAIGILQRQFSQNMMVGNQVRGNKLGVWLEPDSGYHALVNNLIERNEHGVVVESWNNYIASNTIQDNTGASEPDGIRTSGVHFSDKAGWGNRLWYNNILRNWETGSWGVYAVPSSAWVDARNNYWGGNPAAQDPQNDGPYAPGPNPNGTGDTLAGPVSFQPWLSAAVAVPDALPPQVVAGVALPNMLSRLSLWQDANTDPNNPDGVQQAISSGPTQTTLVVETRDISSGVAGARVNLRELVEAMVPADAQVYPERADQYQSWLKSLENQQMWCDSYYGLCQRGFNLGEVVWPLEGFLHENLFEVLRLGEFTVTATVKDWAGNTSTAQIPLTVVDQQTPVKKHTWTAVSTPLKLERNTLGSILSTGGSLEVGAALRWNAQTQRWEQVLAGDQVKPGQGLMLYPSEDGVVPLIYDRAGPPAPGQTPVYNGWNYVAVSVGPPQEPTISLSKAFKGVEEKAGVRGYTAVLSPNQNFYRNDQYCYQVASPDSSGRPAQWCFGGYGWKNYVTPFIWTTGDADRDLVARAAYWFNAEHSDTLPLYGTTPILLGRMPKPPEPGYDLELVARPGGLRSADGSQYGVDSYRYLFEAYPISLNPDEMGDAPPAAHQTYYVKYEADVIPADTAAFYLRQMRALGWEVVDWFAGQEDAWLEFFRQQGDAQMLARIEVIGGTGVHVRMQVWEPGVDARDVPRYRDQEWNRTDVAVRVVMTGYHQGSDEGGNLLTSLRYEPFGPVTTLRDPKCGQPCGSMVIRLQSWRVENFYNQRMWQLGWRQVGRQYLSQGVVELRWERNVPAGLERVTILVSEPQNNILVWHTAPSSP